MTSQEVRALIDAKIKGQGTNVDAGSVLPAILNGILDLIDEGGGGTSDAVQYIPQELTAEQQAQARTNIGAGTYSKPSGGIPASDLASGVIPDDMVKYSSQTLTTPQQMQARKNQGLYYEGEGLVEKTLIVTQPDLQSKVETEDFVLLAGNLQYGDCVVKIGEDAPLAENIKSVYLYALNEGGDGVTLVWSDDIIVRQSSGYVSVESDGGVLYVVYEDNTVVESTYGVFTASRGIWSYYPISDSTVGVSLNTGSDFGLMGVKYDYEGVTIHHIDPKYIKDMYYSENFEETTLNWDGDTTGKESFSQFYYKVSDDAPSKDIIKSITLIQGGNTQVFENPATTVDTHNPKVYSIGQAFAMVVTEDFEDGGSTVTKGIYFAGVEGTYVSQLVYGGTIYHTILPEYIPNSVNPLIVSFINNNGRWMVENSLLASYIVEEIKKGRIVIGKLTNSEAVYYTQAVSLDNGGTLTFLFVSSVTGDGDFTAGATNPLSIFSVPGIFYITVTYNRNNVLAVSGLNNENNAIPMWKEVTL